MSILLLPVSRVTSAFFIERIASVNSACDFLLFMGCFGIPFFVIIVHVDSIVVTRINLGKAFTQSQGERSPFIFDIIFMSKTSWCSSVKEHQKKQ